MTRRARRDERQVARIAVVNIRPDQSAGAAGEIRVSGGSEVAPRYALACHADFPRQETVDVLLIETECHQVVAALKPFCDRRRIGGERLSSAGSDNQCPIARKAPPS